MSSKENKSLENTNSKWIKFSIGLGIVAVMSGIYLIVQKDYISGVSGAVVGFFIIYLNMKQKGI